MVGFAKLRKREHETKTEGNHALIFSRAFQLPTLPYYLRALNRLHYMLHYTDLVQK